MNGNLRILFLMLLHQCLADGFFISYQYYLAAIFVDSLKYTLDNFLRAIVSTHYINCDFHLLGSLSGMATIRNLARNTSLWLFLIFTQIVYLSSCFRTTSARATRMAPVYTGILYFYICHTGHAAGASITAKARELAWANMYCPLATPVFSRTISLSTVIMEIPL